MKERKIEQRAWAADKEDNKQEQVEKGTTCQGGQQGGWCERVGEDEDNVPERMMRQGGRQGG